MKPNVNICLLPTTNHAHIRPLFEAAEWLLLAHLENGFNATISLHKPREGFTNVFLGVHLATADELVLIPPDSVIWNTEYMTEDDPLVQLLCALSSMNTIWDSSERNCQILVEKGVESKLCAPCFVSGQQRLSKLSGLQTDRDLDVVLWGSADTDTITETIDALKQRGLRAAHPVGLIGADWERVVARAHLYLEVCAPGERPSTARQVFLLHNHVPVVTAWGEVDLGASWNDAICRVSPPNMVDACVALLANPLHMQAAQLAGASALHAHSATSMLHSLWSPTMSVDAPAPASAPVHFFCVCHVKPMFRPPHETNWIYTGQHQKDSNSHLSNISASLGEMYPYLAGSAASFAICDELIKQKLEGSVSILQYRKFIAKRPLGIFSSNYPGLISVERPPESSEVFIKDIVSVDGDYCFSVPILIGNMIAQYSGAHHVEDLLRFVACAVEVGVLPARDVAGFFNNPVHIPGGVEFGKFPASVFIEIVSKLRLACERFLQKHSPVAMSDSYQNRALSFCCERLGGWLLVRHLEARFGIPFVDPSYVACFGDRVVFGPADISKLNYPHMFGYMHCIEDGGQRGVYAVGR